MKKLVTTVLAATLATSIIAPQVQAKEDIKVKKSKLVDEKGNVIKGFKTYKGKVYKNGKLFKGVYKGKFYSKGKKSSGTFKGVKYRKGAIFTGKSVDGNYYDGGQVADGVASNGIMYDNGVIYTGSFAGVNYINGKPVVDKVDEDNTADEPVIDDKDDEALPPVVDETKPTEDNTNNNDSNNDNNTTAPEVVNPIPNPAPIDPKPEDNNGSNENTTTPPDNTGETNPTPPVEEVKPPVTEPEQPSDNGNNNAEESNELVLVDGKLYVNPKTGVHYVNGKVQTTPYQYDKKSSQGYFFTEEGKLDVVFSNEEYRIYDLTDVLLSFHVYTNNQIEDVYMWEKERNGLQDNINSLPDSNPKKYLQGEYNKAIQVAIDTYNNHQADLKEKVNDLFKGTHPYYFKEGRHKEQLNNYLKDIDDEDFKNQITEMVNNATEPPSN